MTTVLIMLQSDDIVISFAFDYEEAETGKAHEKWNCPGVHPSPCCPLCVDIFYVVLVKMCFCDFRSFKRTDAHAHVRHHQDWWGHRSEDHRSRVAWGSPNRLGEARRPPMPRSSSSLWKRSVGGCTRWDRITLQALDGTMSHEVLRVWRRSCMGHGSACLDNGEGSRRRSPSWSRTTPCRGRIPCSCARMSLW